MDEGGCFFGKIFIFWGKHGRKNYKDTKPMSAFLSVDLLTEFAAFCLTDFIDWRDTLMVCIIDPASELLPPWTKELYGTCVLLPLYCTFSLPPPPSPPPDVQYSIQTLCDCGGGGGGVEMYGGPYSAGVLHSVSDQIQNLQNCFTTPNKMTSEDDIKGLVSLKFLRPWGKSM
jgi:hypothetical protein